MSDDFNKSDRPNGKTVDGAGRILHMTDFDSAHPARVLAEMRDYWQSLRHGRAVPARSDVEPRGIRRALDYAFILERIAPGAARFRLAGRHLIDLMGMEVRGMPICSFLNPQSRGRLSDVLETVFKAPQIAELRLSARAEYGRPELSGRMLLLPLKSDLGDLTRALGCLVSEGDAGNAPRRFDLVEDRITPIVEGGEIMVPSPSTRGFAEPRAGWKSGNPVDPRATPSGGIAKKPVPAATPEERRATFRIISRDD